MSEFQTVSEIIAERDALRAVNAELVEALKNIIDDMDSDFGTGYDYENARAALAKAKELKGTK